MVAEYHYQFCATSHSITAGLSAHRLMSHYSFIMYPSQELFYLPIYIRDSFCCMLVCTQDYNCYSRDLWKLVWSKMVFNFDFKFKQISSNFLLAFALFSIIPLTRVFLLRDNSLASYNNSFHLRLQCPNLCPLRICLLLSRSTYSGLFPPLDFFLRDYSLASFNNSFHLSLVLLLS